MFLKLFITNGGFMGINKRAFTLAEVLITLAVIGVVAVLTVPVLISNYNKKSVETKLAQFNSMINEVVRLSEIENGSKSGWSYNNAEDFFNKYLSSYLKVVKTEKVSDLMYNIYLVNGTMFSLYQPEATTDTIHLCFYTDAKKYLDDTTLIGKDAFIFLFYKLPGDKLSKERFCNSPYLGEGTGFVPYFFYMSDKKDYWDTEKNCRQIVYPENDEELTDTLLNDPLYGCGKSEGNAYCTKIIQLNGWKIPDDYPIKF